MGPSILALVFLVVVGDLAEAENNGIRFSMGTYIYFKLSSEGLCKLLTYF